MENEGERLGQWKIKEIDWVSGKKRRESGSVENKGERVGQWKIKEREWVSGK